MSVSWQRTRDLVNAYDYSLEQQIVGRGSCLACTDEELWKQVEELLTDGDAGETHRLGLDPLRVMEESLKAAAAAAGAAGAAAGADCRRRGTARGGLKGLAKAFEVLEQAALNLYLGPWREEYKVIKVYSGTFTHYITPALSTPQIESLFSLLGYKPSPSRPEQLRLQSAGVGPASLDDLLRLSCAFFAARCECRLLLTALGKHAGDAPWELSVVRERRDGSSLQVALDNTKKSLGADQPLMEPFDGEVDLYGDERLYGDEQVNGGQREAAVCDDESPRSLSWAAQSRASPPAAVKTHGNGAASPSSPPEPETGGGSSAGRRCGRRPCGESRSENTDSQSRSLQAEAAAMCQSEPEADRFCGCLRSSNLSLRRCINCNAVHNINCDAFDLCLTRGHRVEFGTSEKKTESPRKVRVDASSSLGGGGGSSSAAMFSLTLRDAAAVPADVPPKSTSPSLHPIKFHECCDLTRLDPRVLCFSCGVFHSGSCSHADFCQRNHDIRPLGVCSCGKRCSRKPLVLCRYCGKEYCIDCWYRNPVTCGCGQTFDQSSSV
ncbi:spermatogenesis associated 2-like [Brachyistius frenatus]|uniref:spermatogenesis associated 2-like n=1 Tax=Brachyistius frenatus TaxID=100188 RepID=UPI0037E79B16